VGSVAPSVPLALVALVAHLALAAAACGGDTRPSDARAPDTTAAATPAPRTWEHLGVPFAPESLRVGDTVAGLRVERLRVERAVDGSAVGSVSFAGALRLRGRTMRHPDEGYPAPCFEADSASAERLPRWRGDGRRPWLCFDAPADAAARLGPPSAPRDAEITIDGFTVHRTLSDAVNAARLVTVHRGAPGA
jgi:hypothetical protein